MSSESHVVRKKSGRRRYAQDFKDNAVRMVIELDKPIAQVARDLGINEGTLGHWVAMWREANPRSERSLDVSERAQWKADRRELAELRMENEFLKKPRPSSPRGTSRREV
ncbi:transposase [Trueperella pyogenes]|uniref:transposase n=1 Tax=Trueperella pyogenes TaxID=1661 RepID=UPI00345CDD60